MRKIYDGNTYFILCNNPITLDTIVLTADRRAFQLRSMFKPITFLGHMEKHKF